MSKGSVFLLCVLGGFVSQLNSVLAQVPSAISNPSDVDPGAQLGGVYNCARLPPFIVTKKIQQPVAIDTSVAHMKGMVIRELQGQRRLYQHPSWRVTGHVGSTVRDANGNIYVIPVPSIGLDTNPLSKRNRVYRVDARTAQMTLFTELPLLGQESQTNPFGTLGLSIDCETNSLYVSSVAGSTPKEVLGVIYQISLETGEIVDTFSGVDSLGLAIFKHPTHKRLYYGGARSSSVFSIVLNRTGGFSRTMKVRHELSLLAVRNGSSTQARKLRFYPDQKGIHQLLVSDVEFSFRMLAETSRNVRDFRFSLEEGNETWRFVNITQGQ